MGAKVSIFRKRGSAKVVNLSSLETLGSEKKQAETSSVAIKSDVPLHAPLAVVPTKEKRKNSASSAEGSITHEEASASTSKATTTSSTAESSSNLASKGSSIADANLKDEMCKVFGENTYILLTNSKWDAREIALREIEQRVMKSNVVLVTRILAITQEDRVCAVVQASHDCLLRVLRLRTLPVPKLAKSAKLVLRYYMEAFPESTAHVIQKLRQNVIENKTKMSLGVLEALDLVMQGNDIREKFAENREVILELLQLAFRDGFGPKVRSQATAVVNRIRAFVEEEDFMPLFAQLRPAIVDQINRARDTAPPAYASASSNKEAGGSTTSTQGGGARGVREQNSSTGDELLQKCSSAPSPHLTRRGSHHSSGSASAPQQSTFFGGSCGAPDEEGPLFLEGEEYLMERILDETANKFAKNSNMPGTAESGSTAASSGELGALPTAMIR